jgi:hypothetical protein
MRMARKLGMITYRSAREWEQRFGRERIGEEHQTGDAFAPDFEVEGYLEAHARKFTGQFDANSYLYLSRASDLFDVAEHGGSVTAGLAKVRAARVLVVGVETDLLFPIAQQRELASGLDALNREVHFVELPSIQGHDSFLVDMDRFRPVLEVFFAFQARFSPPARLGAPTALLRPLLPYGGFDHAVGHAGGDRVAGPHLFRAAHHVATGIQYQRITTFQRRQGTDRLQSAR